MHRDGGYGHLSPQIHVETTATVRPLGSDWFTKPLYKQLVYIVPSHPLHVSLTPQEIKREQTSLHHVLNTFDVGLQPLEMLFRNHTGSGASL